MSQSGYVYILTNDSFREDWIKIGKSWRPVDIRSKELDNTAVPLPFTIYATMKTVKYNEVEKLVHKTIDRLSDLRVRQNREFFNISPQVALDIFRDIARAIDDAEITIYKNNVPLSQRDTEQIHSKISSVSDNNSKRQKPFLFSMIGAQVGEELIFVPTGAIVKIANDRMIEYEGRLYTLTAFTCTHIPERMRNKSGKYRGPSYFSYHGEVLTALRKKATIGKQEEG